MTRPLKMDLDLPSCLDDDDEYKLFSTDDVKMIMTATAFKNKKV